MNKIIQDIKLLVPAPVKALLKNALDSRFLNPNWYKVAVGGMWEEIGQLQFDFLVAQGLKPEHHLMDVGCGSLRGGLHFIRYLEPAHYYGVDINNSLLNAGKYEVKYNQLNHKYPTLLKINDFDFISLNQKVDFALAQSLFTHLSLNSIIRCIMNVEKILVRGGQFYATFNENHQGKFNLEPIFHTESTGVKHITYFDKDVYHYDFETFKWICEGTGLRVTYLGNWNHPRGQMMMVFTRL